MPMSLRVGDRVLLPEYGGSKIIVDDKVKAKTFLCILKISCCFIFYRNIFSSAKPIFWVNGTSERKLIALRLETLTNRKFLLLL